MFLEKAMELDASQERETKPSVSKIRLTVLISVATENKLIATGEMRLIISVILLIKLDDFLESLVRKYLESYIR